ncbi:peptidase inhibitor family I36 protein [Actinomadura flavalba]|uniref:peptidase inhibitor family I36 protein n=1 Tax=Actinomadura flavalba TaxID=1120938 RepID=UPI00037DC1BD|nr:peptidase inhibitor family I36 protein [Actinomadura flavalba]
MTPTRSAILTATAATALLAPATPATATAPGVLPPGITALPDSAPCPANRLCLYRDYGRRGPAYAIPAGRWTNLSNLPMATGNGTAADNVSSWHNTTRATAVLANAPDDGRLLPRGTALEEPAASNDTVDHVLWLP